MEELEAKKAQPPITTGQAVFLLAALALVLVAVLGRYETKRDGYNGTMWRLDRWTGEQVWCAIPPGSAPFCRKLPAAY
jgi:hypothetical protein